MPAKDDSCPTRASLLARLKDTGDEQSWGEFNTVYRPLIRGFALKAGLTEAEADEVAQETLASAAQHLPEFHYDPKRCSFKTWLLNLSRWRVTDQLRKRLPLAPKSVRHEAAGDESRTATIDKVPDPAGADLERLWDGEWRATMLQRALERVKEQVEPRQWQVFDLYALKDWKPTEVAHAVRVSVGKVYLIKHRVGKLLKNEIRKLENSLI